jgi:ATP-dependent DNA helicase RecG
MTKIGQREHATQGLVVQVVWRPTPQVTPQADTTIDAALTQLAGALGLSTPQATQQVAQQVARLLEAVAEQPHSREELQQTTGLKDREHFRAQYMAPLLAAQWLAYTIPDSHRNPHQQYEISTAGREWLERYKASTP